MVQHRMIVGEIELADHPHRVMPGLHAGELDAGLGMKQFAAGQLARKSKCHQERRNSPSVASFRPIGACLCTTFSISHVLGLAQIVGGDFALLQPGARFLDARRPQQAADLVGAERGFGSLHGLLLPNTIGRIA